MRKLGRKQALEANAADLRIFLAVLETGTITAGARRADLSLAAASERLQALEHSLGVRLFERSRYGVTPTEAGLVFERHGRSVLLQLERMCSDLLPFARGVRGRIRLLCNTAALSEFLPETIGDFLASYSDVDVEVEEMWSRQIVQAIREGRGDVGILSDFGDTSGVETRSFRSDRLVMISAPTHPLARRRLVAFADTLDYPFVGLTTDSALHRYLSDHANRLGRSIHYRVKLRSLDSICRLVAQNVGLSVIPGRAAKRLAAVAVTAVRELSDDWARRQLLICTRASADLPGYVRDLVDALAAPDRNVGPRPDRRGGGAR
jgi:DNA-binding transcriptional LysR family regulator